jgi:YHS domain-containing protein
MRRLAVLAAFAALACDSSPSKPAAAQKAAKSEMRTINEVAPQPAKLEPPPMLTDEAPPPKPKVLPWETQTPVVFSPEDEKLRASLPFTPAIAMDPIDGSKLSIRATTPTLEYKGRVYYFSSEANKQTFQANPSAYLTGRFTKL